MKLSMLLEKVDQEDYTFTLKLLQKKLTNMFPNVKHVGIGKNHNNEPSHLYVTVDRIRVYGKSTADVDVSIWQNHRGEWHVAADGVTEQGEKETGIAGDHFDTELAATKFAADQIKHLQAKIHRLRKNDVLMEGKVGDPPPDPEDIMFVLKMLRKKFDGYPDVEETTIGMHGQHVELILGTIDSVLKPDEFNEDMDNNIVLVSVTHDDDFDKAWKVEFPSFDKNDDELIEFNWWGHATYTDDSSDLINMTKEAIRATMERINHYVKTGVIEFV